MKQKLSGFARPGGKKIKTIRFQETRPFFAKNATKLEFELVNIDTRRIKSPMAKGLAFLLLNCVCGNGNAEEAEKWIRTNHPAGASGNWHLATEKNRRPVPCDKFPERTHYMFVC